MKVYLRTSNWQLPTIFEEREISSINNRKGIFGIIDLNKSHPHYPDRGDTKIMRQDVISSILTIDKIIEKAGISEEQLRETALYVSNGSFLEEENKHTQRLIRALEKFTQLKTKQEKREILYKNISPLTALETLTNSTMSFIAQYAKIKGLNTTFGNTSYSSFIALKEGVNKLKYEMSKIAVVGGSNGGGIYSALNFMSFQESDSVWKESLCSAYLLLQTDPTDCTIKIDSCHNDRAVPSLINKVKSSNWKQFFTEGEKPDVVVYSGGYTETQFDENRKEVENFSANSYSLNDHYGNTGASAMFLNMIKAEKIILEEGFVTAALLDRDAYGRETCIKISKL